MKHLFLGRVLNPWPQAVKAASPPRLHTAGHATRPLGPNYRTACWVRQALAEPGRVPTPGTKSPGPSACAQDCPGSQVLATGGCTDPERIRSHRAQTRLGRHTTASTANDTSC